MDDFKLIKPLRDKVYIIPLKDRGKRGSIIVPLEYERMTAQGIIKYMGEGTRERTGCKVGDHVLFSPYAGSSIAEENEGYLNVVGDDAIVAILTKEPGQYLFTRPDLEEFVEKAMNQLVLIGFEASIVASLEEFMTTRITEHFKIEALEY